MKNDVKEAIWLAIKDNVLKKTWFKIFAVLFVLGLGFGIFKVYLSPTVTKGEIGNKEVWDSYEDVDSDFHAKSKTLDGIEVEVEKTESTVDSRDIETVIIEFFNTANTNNSDLFVSSLTPEQLDKDFSKYTTVSERFQKIDEAMNRISRNGQIEKIDVIRSLMVLEKGAVRVVIDVYYKDLAEPLRINLIVKMLEQYAFNASKGETMKFPYVSTSVWDVIKVIEGE